MAPWRSPLEAAGTNQSFIRITLAKPGDEGLTTRDIDPELMFVLMMHTIVGGSVLIEAHGPARDYYYSRLYLPGTTNGQQRRVYLSRLIVGTEPGSLTRESPNFHDLRRQSLKQASDDVLAKLGREQARQYTAGAIAEALAHGQALPCGLDAPRAAALLDDDYRLLNLMPLGA
jgi:hypothetical protein